MILSFGDCEIDVERRELRRAGTPVHVEPQVFDLLVYLTREPRAGHQQGRSDRLGLGRPNRVGFDADQPHQRRAQGDRRQRRGPEDDPDRAAQGPSIRRRRAATNRWRQDRPSRRSAGGPGHRAVAPGVAAARPARDCGASLHQYERRCGAGIFFRRDQRGHHHRTVQAALVLRDRAQLLVRLQGQGRAHEAGRRGTRRRLCRRGQRAQERRPRAHHGSAQRRRDRQPYLGRALRPRPCRRVRGAG